MSISILNILDPKSKLNLFPNTIDGLEIKHGNVNDSNNYQIITCLNPELLWQSQAQAEVYITNFTNHNPEIPQEGKNRKIIALNKVPRSTKAQAIDILSAINNLMGYQAMITACAHYPGMLGSSFTAAGRLNRAKVVVIGCGIAGLQAIATAKRLGALVCGFDTRKAAEAEVTSLGAQFIKVSDDDFSQNTGYSAATSQDYDRKQKELLIQELTSTNILITTALIGSLGLAPTIVTEDMVKAMPKDAIIVDLVAGFDKDKKGGNCEISKIGEIIDHQGIKIIGNCSPNDMHTAVNQMQGNIMKNLIFKFLIDKNSQIKFDDETISAMLVSTHL